MRKHLSFVVLLVAMALGIAEAGAQTAPERIGLLGPPEEPRFSEVREGLKQGLRDQGYADGRIEIVEARVTRADDENVRRAVEGFVRQRVKVLVVIGSSLARLARNASAEIPIVYITPGDPVEQALVASLARPGGKTTAMTFEFPELTAKRLALLRETVPRVHRVLALYDPRDESSRRSLAVAREAAQKLGVALVARETRTSEDISRALETLGTVDAFLVIPGGLPTGFHAEIISAANAKRIPTMFHAQTGSTMAALVTYGPSDANIARQIARHVAKVLQGTNAGDLPVERPTTFELVVNLKTAKQIGVTVASDVLLRADRIIR